MLDKILVAIIVLVYDYEVSRWDIIIQPYFAFCFNFTSLILKLKSYEQGINITSKKLLKPEHIIVNTELVSKKVRFVVP